MSEIAAEYISCFILVAVNSTLAVVLALFLVYDYQREFAERLNDKRIALEEEAKTLLPAVKPMRHYGETEVQRYIDDVCARILDFESHSRPCCKCNRAARRGR